MQTNVAKTERLVSALAGAFALGRAIRKSRSEERFSLGQALLGVASGSLMFRALSGYCPVYEAAGFSTSSGADAAKTGFHFDKATIVNKTLDEVRRFLREDGQAAAAFHQAQSEDEFKVVIAGQHWSLRLSAEGLGKRTRIEVHADDASDAGLLARCLATVSDKPALVTGIVELRHLKAMIETGEVATIVGQPHGKRSLLGGAVASVADRFRASLDEGLPLTAHQERAPTARDKRLTKDDAEDAARRTPSQAISNEEARI